MSTPSDSNLRALTHALAIWWSSPNSIIGHGLGRIGATHHTLLPNHITEYYGNPILTKFRISAIVFGNTINYAPGVDPASPCARYDQTCNVTSLRAHENAHIHQYRACGIFFIPAYLLSEAWARTLGTGINPFETAADNASTDRT
jgi:hypothetical protein